jgi:hypothetical protein
MDGDSEPPLDWDWVFPIALPEDFINPQPYSFRNRFGRLLAAENP